MSRSPAGLTDPDQPPLSPDSPDVAQPDAPADSPPISWERRLLNVRTGISFLVGLAVLVVVVQAADVNLEATGQVLLAADPWLYLLAIGCYVCTFPVRGLRWRRLLGNVGYPSLPLLHLTEVIYLSWFVNSIAPAKLGDVYRGYLLKRTSGVSFAHTMGTVAAERVIDVLALIVLLAASGLLVLQGRVGTETTHLVQLGTLVVVVIALGMLALRHVGPRVSRFFSVRIQGMYARFQEGIFHSFRGMPVVVALTLLAWLAEAARLFFVLHALHVPLLPVTVLFVLTTASLLLVAPTPGGLGAVETGMVAVLVLVGQSPEVALGVALLDRSISYWGLIVTGLPVFFLGRQARKQDRINLAAGNALGHEE